MAQIPIVSGGSQPVFAVDQLYGPIPATEPQYGGNVANTTPTSS